MVMVTGAGPQSKVITPPAATAATTACDVQLAGVPLPITRVGRVVSTAAASGGTGAPPPGLPAGGGVNRVVVDVGAAVVVGTAVVVVMAVVPVVPVASGGAAAGGDEHAASSTRTPKTPRDMRATLARAHHPPARRLDFTRCEW
ncbi:hypothetical protein GCM10027184_28780 [Saccharothrix stipae]